MSRWDEIKKMKIGTTSDGDGSNLSRWDKIKSIKPTISSDGSDIKQFADDYNNFAKAISGDYSSLSYGSDTSKKRTEYEQMASEFDSRYRELLTKYNLNRMDLTDEEKELKSYLNNIRYSALGATNNITKLHDIDPEYKQLMSAEDFEHYKQIGKDIDNPTWDDASPKLNIFGWKPFGESAEVNNIVTFAEANKGKGMLASAKALQGGGSGNEYTEIVNLINTYMTDEEKSIYNYYVGKGDTEKANEYITQLKDVFNQRAAGEIAEQVDDTALELVFSTVAGLDQFASGVKNLDNFIMGTEGDTTSAIQYAQSGMSSNNKGIWKVSNDLLNTTGNMLPSILVSTIPVVGKPLGLATMGASVVGNSYAEMKNLGYSDWQARGYATLVGAAETGLQALLGGIGKLGGKYSLTAATTKLVSKFDNALAKLAIKVPLNMASEGLEESIQTVLEPAFKALLTGEDFEAPEWEEILYSGLLGALSAGVLDGAPTIAGTAYSNIQAKKAYGDGSAIVNEALGVATEGSDLEALANKYKGKLDDGKSLSGSQIISLDEAIRSNDVTKIKSAAEARLTELGETGDVSAIADILVKQATGEKLTLSEKATLKKSTFGQRVSNEINPENIKSGQYSSSWAENIGTRRVSPETYNKPLYDLAKAVSGVRESAETDSVAKTVAENQKATEAKFEASESGKTTYTDAEGNTTDVAVKKVVSTKGGIKVELDNGETVSAKDLSFSTQEEALMYEMVTRMEVTPDTANDIINTFKPTNAKQSLQYMSYVPLAYEYGKIGYVAGLKNIELSENEKRIAYNRGRMDAITDVKNKPKTTVTKKTKASEVTKTDNDGIIYEGDFTYDEASANELQKASMIGIRAIAKMSSLEVHIFESVVENGERVYHLNGERKPAPNGYFTHGNKIYIDINAGNGGEGAMLYTMSHEITHYIRRWNAKGFKELGDFLIAEYGKKGVPVNALLEAQKDKIKQRYKEEKKTLPSEAKLADMAYEEMVSDAMSEMFADPKAYEKLAKLKKKNLKVWQKLGEAIKQFLDKLKTVLGVYKSKDVAVAKEAYEVRGFSADVYNKLQDLYLKAFVDADANYEATIGSRNLNDFSVAKNENGEPLFQYRAMEADEDTYRNMLQRWGKMSDAQINNLFTTIDTAMELIKDNLEVLDFAWEADIDDRAFSPVKPNSDKLYQVSLDYSTLCRKRILQQTVQAQLQDALNKPLTREEGIAIRDALIALQEEGRQIEVACALCYVESARMKSPEQIKRFVENKEKVIKEFFAGKSGGDIKSKIKQDETNAREKLHKENPNGIKGKDGTTMLDPRTASLKALPKKYADVIRDAKKGAKESYTPTAEETKLIEAAKGMTVSDFTSPEGLENLAKNYPDLFDAYTSYVRNATKSKGIENDTWWRAGDSMQIGDVLIANMNRENGLRSQSWSDFQVIHILDYIASTIELATRNTKEQAYSKVPDYVELMGNTGVMINMSLIPTAKFNGSLDYDSVEGIDYKRALELRDKYHATAGTICIGVDNVQIKLLLADTTIDYVIPYHKSGMAAHIRKAMHIPTWSEYESYQSEKNLSRTDAEKQAKKYGVTLLDASDPNYQKGTSFSEWFDIKEAQQIAKMENANPSDKAKQKKYGVMYGGYMAMQNAANNYLKLCAERGITPKFSHEKADFTTEENYWKLLIDRKMVDNVTGEVIEQQTLKPIFNQGEIMRILNDELARYPKVKADQDYAIRTVTEKMLSGEIKGGMSAKAIAEVMKKPVDNVTNVNILASSEDTKFSDRDSLGNELSAEQQEYFKDSKVRDPDGRLTPVYHGTPSGGFTEFKLPFYLKTLTSAQGAGFYFTDKANARQYMRGLNGKSVSKKQLYEVYLNITTPLEISEYSTGAISDEVFRKIMSRGNYEWGMAHTDVDKILRFSTLDSDRLAEMVRVFNGEEVLTVMKEELGYDGVHYSDKYGDIWVAWDKSQIKNTTNKAPTSDPDIRYSVREIVGDSGKNYGIGVYLDSQLLSNLSEAERIEMVKEYVKELGGSVFTAYDNNHNEVDVHIVESNRKFKNKSGKKVPVNRDMTNYLNSKVKQEAIALIDELIITSTYRGTEPATHPHDWVDNNGANDWDVWTTYLQDKENTVWEAKLRIANSTNGEKILYDIFPIEMVEQSVKSDTSTTITEEQSRTMDTSTSGKSITHPEEIVNSEFSGDVEMRSDRDSYAPTFYSYMGNIIDGIRLEKMGANGVVPYLKGKGVKDEEIKWSGIETWLEGKKSVTKAELQEFVAGSQLVIEEENSVDTDTGIKLIPDSKTGDLLLYIDGNMEDAFFKNEDGVLESRETDYLFSNERMLLEAYEEDYGRKVTRWSQYQIGGGANYREIVFKMPNSTYSNRAMRGHWGQDAEGILVHARIQDVDVDGKKMLFIEELQSDWHNEGREKGYSTPEYEDAVAVYDKLANEYQKVRTAFNKYVRSSEFRSDSDEVSKKKFDWLRRKVDTAEKRMQDAERDVNKLKEKGMGDVADAPFKNNYHEYVLKRLLRMAAEEGYDSIGWTTADIQSKRWSEDYAEGYRIEYDQDIPKFLRKYGKKWGATVEKINLTEGKNLGELEADLLQMEAQLEGSDGAEKRLLENNISIYKDHINNLQNGVGNDVVWSMTITDSMTESVLYEGQVMYSDRVTDKETLDFLENQEHITTYKSFVEIDGKLYSPMATKVRGDDGKYRLTNPSEIGVWQQAEEKPDSIPKFNKSGYGYYVLKKDDGSSVTAAYNPYEHSSNLVLNDQFESAYQRPNLVTVECIIPKSEMASGYKAKYAKDSTGYLDWKSGTVAGKLKGNKRKVYLSRWLKPVRILSDSEVASMYKDILGTKISVPFNVVTPQLRTELEKAGVKIDYEGSPGYQYRQNKKATDADTKLSDRDTDAVSNRTLLAGALESVAKNDIERNKLKKYKEKITLIESEQKKLNEIRAKANELRFTKGRTPNETKTMRDLDFEANQIANRISTYDKQLLNLESTAALKGVLEREKAMLRKRLMQKEKDSIKAVKERATNTQRELLTRYHESRTKAIEGRNKTEMRHKIKGITKELNTLLLNPTAKKHIKEELRKEVADALSAINMDTVDSDARVAKYNALIARERDPDIIAELTKTRDNIQLQGDNLKQKLTTLQNAYEKIKATEDIELSLSYQEVIRNSIKNVTDKVGNTSIRNMTLEQLEMVYELFTMIRTTVRGANKAFKAKKGETIMQMAEAVNDQVRTVGGQPYKRNAILAVVQRVGWTFLKPFVAFRTIGSVTLTNMYKELRVGEDTFYKDVSEAQTFIEGQYKKHGYKSWNMKKTKEFTAKSGKTFKLTLEQMMTLYAYSRREQAHKHIIEGGIVFEDALIVEKNKLGIPMKYEVTTKDAFNLSEETFTEIANSLTAEQKAFVDSMQSYLSDVMGAKGNEVSMDLLGIKLFKEQFYLPIKSSQYYMNFKAEDAGEVKLKSPAFSKETVTHANNPIVLHSFTDLWAEHVNDMAMYHSFVLALEDFTRVYNYKTKTDAKVETMDTKATLETAYPGVTNYINKFLKDMNGGVRAETVGWAEKLTSLAKKGSVLGSASVAIQQPSAVMRAMAMINPKYFVTTAHKSVNLVKHKQDFEELKKYAPIAGIKEMGRFDVGMGQGTVDWIKSNKTVMEKGEEIFSSLPAFMDEVTWVSIWNAVKQETAHNNPNLKTSSDEFLKLSGERFTDVISLTQVYDSVFSRSDLMRNKSWIAKATTAFMAEPTTTLNMIWDAWVQAKRAGSFKAYAKTTATTGGSIVASIVLNAALKSIVMAMRDDDEDESYAEKYLESLFSDLKGNLNPLTLVPFAKDIVSIFKGYDVERMDVALFTDLKKAMDAFDSDSKTMYEKWSGLIGAVSAFFGVPIKNVERDIRSLINTFFGKTEDTTAMGILNAIEKGWTGEEESNAQQLYEAMIKGDSAHIERLKGRFDDEADIDAAIRKALRENDSRIKEAAMATISGNGGKRVTIQKEIISEGHFKQDYVVEATNAEIQYVRTKVKEAKEYSKKGKASEVEKIYNALLERGYSKEFLDKVMK